MFSLGQPHVFLTALPCSDISDPRRANGVHNFGFRGEYKLPQGRQAWSLPMRALFDHAVMVFAFVGMAFWAFGVHWDALIAAMLLVSAYVYMAHPERSAGSEQLRSRRAVVPKSVRRPRISEMTAVR
jgi:hypothetical protein